MTMNKTKSEDQMYKTISSAESSDYSRDKPVDAHGMAYIIMFYEGVGNLFPWNAFITAASYFAIRFCGSQFSESFENYFSFAYTLSQTVGLAISVKYQHSMSLQTKIIYPLMLYSVSFIVTTAFVLFDVNATLLFWLTLLITCVCGVCGAILSGGLFGLSALFPPAYTGALMNGQGLAGLIVSVSNVVTLVATASTDSSCSSDSEANDDTCEGFSINYSALAYFLIATFIMLSCAASFLVLAKLPYTRYHVDHHVEKLHEPLLEETETFSPLQRTVTLTGSADDFNLSGSVNTAATEEVDVNSVSLATIWTTYKQILVPALSVTLTFTITIGLFPSLIVYLESKDKCSSSERFFNDLFVPFQFLLFNLFDLCGRVTAGLIQPVFTAKNIWMGSLARIIFFPLFLLCKISGSQLPTLLVGDFFPIIIMILFAFTNGYIASLCMMLGPSQTDKKYASLAGNIMIFSLTIGLLCGACTSFLTVFISQGSI